MFADPIGIGYSPAPVDNNVAILVGQSSETPTLVNEQDYFSHPRYLIAFFLIFDTFPFDRGSSDQVDLTQLATERLERCPLLRVHISRPLFQCLRGTLQYLIFWCIPLLSRVKLLTIDMSRGHHEYTPKTIAAKL